MGDFQSRYEILAAIMGPPNTASFKEEEHSGSQTKNYPVVVKCIQEHDPVDTTNVLVADDLDSNFEPFSITDEYSKYENTLVSHSSTILNEPYNESPSSSSSDSSSRSTSPFSQLSSQSLRLNAEEIAPSSLINKAVQSTLRLSEPLVSPIKCPLSEQFINFINQQDSDKVVLIRGFLLPHLASLTTKNVSEPELDKLRHSLYNWWVSILRRLQSNISTSERITYTKAILAIAKHHCWNKVEHSALLYLEHQLILYDTLTFVVHLLSQKSLPYSLTTFCASILVLSFFQLPLFADHFLSALDVKKKYIDALGSSFDEKIMIISHKYLAPFFTDQFSSTMHPYYPKRTSTPFTIGYNRQPIEFTRAWMRRFESSTGGFFFEFLSCYHSFLALQFSFELPDNVIYFAPGYICLHAYLLELTISVIHISDKKPLMLPTGHEQFPCKTLPEVNPSMEEYNPKMPVTATTLSTLQQFVGHIKDAFKKIGDCRQEQMRLLAVLEQVLINVAKNTPAFNLQSCFLLCSLVEQCFGVFNDFSHRFDFSFWISVAKRLISTSHNMSIVRSITFIYAVWPYLDIKSKELVTLQWLLEENTFQELFLHWSPLVRAYFQRLVCWRFLKLDDMEEFQFKGTVTLRVKNLLKHYFTAQALYHEECLVNGRASPITKPSEPVPMRRLTIVCNHYQNYGNSESTEFELSNYKQDDGTIQALVTDVVSISNSFSSGLKKAFGSLFKNVSGLPAETEIAYHHTLSASNSYVFTDLVDNPDSMLKSTLKYRFVFKFSPSQPLSSLGKNKEKYDALLERSSHGVLPVQSKMLLYNSNHISCPLSSIKGVSVNGKRLVYTSRALVEWALVVNEFDHALSLRKGNETEDMEAPTLTVRIPKSYASNIYN